MTKLDQAIQYAIEHMPMKNYASIVAKSFTKMDYDEQVKAISLAGNHKFYATASITVGKKEIIVTEASDVDKTGAVCLALAKLQLNTANHMSQFKVASRLSDLFVTTYNQ